MGWRWGATMTRMAEVGGDAGGGGEGDLGGAGSGQAGWRHGRGVMATQPPRSTQSTRCAHACAFLSRPCLTPCLTPRATGRPPVPPPTIPPQRGPPPPRPPPAAAPAATGGPGPGPRAGGSSRRPGSKLSVGGAAGGGWRPAAAAGPDAQSCCVMDPWGGPSLTEILAEPTSAATVPPIPIVSMRASFSAPLVHHAGGA
jgi:hypothetical protein